VFQAAPSQNHWTLLPTATTPAEFLGLYPTNAAVGKRFMHLRSDCPTPSIGGVYQDISTVVDQAYILSFAASGGDWNGRDNNDFGL
jgi:hypothetical protein